ncbi:MAG: LamG domain-containing protein [Chloroflexota bacterium]
MNTQTTGTLSAFILFFILATPALADSPLAYWSLDEGAGQPRLELINGYHLTDPNSQVIAISGYLNRAADFEREASDYLTLTDPQQLNITGDLTLTGWVNIESSPQLLYGIFAAKYRFGSNPSRGYRLGMNQSNQLYFVVSDDGGFEADNNLTGSIAMIPGEWHHVAAVFDGEPTGGTMTLYLDGRLDATKTVSFNSINASNAPFMLGANLQDNTIFQHFDGGLDDWRVYDRALSQTEIGLLRAGTGNPSTGLPTGTAHTYTLTSGNLLVIRNEATMGDAVLLGGLLSVLSVSVLTVVILVVLK